MRYSCWRHPLFAEPRSRERGFSLIELLVVVLIIVILMAILLPALRSAKLTAWRVKSMSNVHQILVGTASYRFNNNDYFPMVPSFDVRERYDPAFDYKGHAAKYIGICGWTGWGKNNNGFWAGYKPGLGNPLHDWHAADRVLNKYIQDDGTLDDGGLPKTAHFTPTAKQRKLERPVFMDPSDSVSYLRNNQKLLPEQRSAAPSVSMSSYDDVGTSYIWNWKWYLDPKFTALFPHSDETPKAAYFAPGARMLRDGHSYSPSRMVFINDQYADAVPVNGKADYFLVNGFRQRNKSILGFTDGHVDYLPIFAGGYHSIDGKSMSNANYSFIFDTVK